MRILGIDWGTNRIGVAMGDSENKIATPLGVVKNIDELVKLAEEERVEKIIVGLPVTLQGKKGNMTDNVEKFIGRLEKLIDIPVETIDERLTTKMSKALEGGKKEKAEKDAVSAMLILQSYLDRL